MRYFTPRQSVLWMVFSLFSLIPTVSAEGIIGAKKILSPSQLDSTITAINFDLTYAGCGTALTVSVTASIEGGTPPFIYNWSNGDATQTINNLAAGTYSLTVTDSTNATFVDSFMLREVMPIQVTKDVVTDARCQGSADGQIAVRIFGGIPDYTLAWNTGADSTNLGLLNPGRYILTVTDAIGCSVVDTTIIGQTNELSVEIVEQLPATGENIADGVATAAATGGFMPYTFNWDNGVVGESNFSLAPGTHSVTVTDSIGCRDNVNFTTIFSELMVEISAFRNARCFGSADGFASVTSMDGVAPYQYNWSTGDTTETITGLVAGTYMVTVTDANGLEGQTSINILDGTPIFFNATITPPTCPDRSNGGVRLAATGGREPYLYDIGIGITPVGIVGGVSSGVKRYRVFSADGCTADTIFTLVPLSPGDPIANFQATVVGRTVTLTDASENEPVDYLWEFGNGDTSVMVNPVYTYPDTGSFEICLTTTNFCAESQTCQQIEIRGSDVPAVNLTIGSDTAGLSGSIIEVPFRVGAISNLLSIQGDFELTNTTLASIVGISDFNLPGLGNANFVVQGNGLTIQWTASDSLPINLAGNTRLFTVRLLLGGEAGGCTGFSPTSNVIFSTLADDIVQPAPLNIIAGDICIARIVSISGTIQREVNESTGLVQVIVEGGEERQQIQGVGEYQIDSLPGGASYRITPFKEDDLLVGVTTMDAARILMHILLENPLESPFRIIAADIDNSGAVNSLDLVFLQQLILQQIDAFPNSNPWRFVPQDYTFTNPTNPFGEDFPEFLFLQNVEEDVMGADFVSIKIGDVISGGDNSNFNKIVNPTSIQIKDQHFDKGAAVVVPINIEEQANVLGFQMEIQFDPTVLAFTGVNAANYLNINERNIGIKEIENGLLKIVWLNAGAISFDAMKEGHFQLAFEAKKEGQLSDVVQMPTQSFKPELYSLAAKTINNHQLTLQFETDSDIPSIKETIAQSNFQMTGESDCDNGIDDDGDGLIDCEDIDCFCACNLTGPNCVGPCDSLQLDANRSMATPACVGTDGAAYTFVAENGTAPYTYTLNDSVSATGIFMNLVPGSYELTIQDSAGCTQIDSIIVPSLDSLPDFDFSVSATSITLLDRSNNNPTSWSWTFDSVEVSTLSNPFLNIAEQSGEVEVCLTTTNDCGGGTFCRMVQFMDNMPIDSMPADTMPMVDSLELLLLAGDPLCNEENGSIAFAAFGGVPPYSFTWSPAGSIEEGVLNNLAAGTYFITVTDSLGTTLTDSVELVAFSPVTLDRVASEINGGCVGDSTMGTGSLQLAATGGMAPYTFDLNGSISMTGNYSGLFSGRYFLSITDVDGCTSLDTIDVPTLTSTPAFIFTVNETTVLFEDVSENNPTEWFWTFGDVATSVSPTQVLNLEGLGDSLEVCLATTNQCGMDTTCRLIIFGDSIVQMPFMVTLNTQDVSCLGGDGSISVMTTGGTPPFVYEWSDTSLMGSMVSNLMPGNYAVTVTDSIGNVDSAMVMLMASMLELNLDSSQITPACMNEQIGSGSFQLVATGGTPPYTYNLNGSMNTSGRYNNLFAGTYFLSIEDANGCSVMDTVELPAIPIPVAGFEFMENAEGTAIQFTDTSTNMPTSWLWTFGSSDSSIMQNPVFDITDINGMVEVCLTVGNACGMDTICQTITIENRDTTGGEMMDGPITLTVDNLIRVTDDTVIVPIRASQFVNVVSYQHSIQLSDTLQSRIIGVSDLNLPGLTESNFFQVNSYSMTTAWFDPTAMGVSVNNDAVLYNLIIVKNDLADDCIVISINGNIIPIQFVVNQDGTIMEADVVLNNGSICSGDVASLFGNIRTATGRGVSNVAVMLTNGVGDTIAADDGFYGFDGITLGSRFDIVPSRDDSHLERVTTFDIVLINRHILNIEPLDSPYKLIAADVNRSNSITVFDLVLLQRLILNLNTNFPNNTSWRFVPADYVFPDPTDPFALPLFPESISISSFTGNLMNQDFVAIKIGDVSFTSNQSLTVAESRSANTMVIQTQNQAYEAGKTFDVPLQLTNLDEFNGFQIELAFDPSLATFKGMVNNEGINLQEDNVSYEYLSQGKVLISWIAPQARLSNTTVINLQFESKTAGSVKNLLTIGNRYLTPEAYTNELQIADIALTVEENPLHNSSDIELFPNPTNGVLNIDLSAKTDVQAISLFTITGKEVVQMQNVEDMIIQLDLNDQSEGTYLLVVKSKEGVETKRVVIAR